MGMSFWHVAIVVLVVVLLFGRGKISDLMGDVAKGVKSFKEGLADEPTEPTRIQPRQEETYVVNPETKVAERAKTPPTVG
ncbi:sec-independent protein translocase protein TatA [Faunimonas pinastri]|uniref:Sec-independent protein translocase protein TatA n=1 Tax=Faunimonas pinastri TaxID=1855383 RepID=A0A1H9L1H0_9HYPH|nr:twin-arginine translocase TatA/TatE family subunit [Faunimonas pinastri]SER04987.1 sec-independent protein translocase protein TatA [Faunimonas pinastri]